MTDLQPFLRATSMVDADHPDVRAVATRLAGASALDTIAACFHFVRDEIRHSGDARDDVVTLRASEVLRAGTGWCYAKSHLLAALLRCHEIPTGLCYQRLRFSVEQPAFCLHGLNAVWLTGHGWYRLDARGNKADVDAEFLPPQSFAEQLAFPLGPDERDVPGVFADTLPVVRAALERASSYAELVAGLPDLVPSAWPRP